jgi:hypothetical protein
MRDALEVITVTTEANSAIKVGSSGWIAYANAEHPTWILARLAEGEDGRLIVVELRLAGERIHSGVLRRVPISKLEMAVNYAPGVAELVRAGLDRPPLPELEAHAVASWEPFQPGKRPLTVPRLEIPRGRKSDDFYRRVAEIYAQLVPLTRRPAADMAEAAGAPAVTVHRWIAEARKRGFLPPAERGRRG